MRLFVTLMVNLQVGLINQNFICYFFLTPYFILKKSKNIHINLFVNFIKKAKKQTLNSDYKQVTK